jgi:hypothetical protein
MPENIFLRLYRSLPVIHELVQIRNYLAALPQKLGELAALRLIEVDMRSNPRFTEPRRLLLFGFQVCSQNQEDGMIHEIFNRIGITSRVFVEIGVGDGIENNTAFLLSQGWNGFWIDGDSTMLKTISERNDLNNGCLRTLVSFVTKENSGELLEQLEVPQEFDLLSLDIDQNTYYAWEGLERFRPRVVVIEYNGKLPPDVNWKVQYDPKRTPDGTQNYGASLKALELLGRRLGYSLVGCDFVGVNAFFVRDDLVGDKFAEPFSSENHFEPFRHGLTHHRGHTNSILDRGLTSSAKKT